MATRFLEQATSQLAPVYEQQIAGIQSQIPAIQQLYQTLTQGLQQQNQMQLETGTQNIVEDASRRGVLRSTLPVDARTSLVGQLGAALNEGLGRLGLQQTQDIGSLNERIAGLRVSSAKDIADLARALETQDLERLKLEETIRSNRASEDISRASARAGAGGGGTETTRAEEFAAALAGAAGNDGKVSPGDYNALKQQWVAAGYGSYKDFHDKFWRFVNENHWWDYR